jgi:chemotaxis methyl-accepting protein methylase
LSQDKVITDITEKLKSKGLVILGDHERLQGNFTYVGKDGISAFSKG